jgi:hypothetical protein
MAGIVNFWATITGVVSFTARYIAAMWVDAGNVSE